MQRLFTVLRTALCQRGVKFNSIIWDWNGTLLNDLEIAIGAINQLLGERGLPRITTERYLETFTFPVRDYYEKIGFDLINELFEIPAARFTAIYNKAVANCPLHEEVIPLLGRLKDMGCRQFIVSAMEQEQLEKTVTDSGIRPFFEDLCGLNNHFAASKVEAGLSLITQRRLNPDTTLMVGDTIHDFEVAQSLGCSCILVANGHQSKGRLLSTGVTVLDRLEEIKL